MLRLRTPGTPAPALGAPGGTAAGVYGFTAPSPPAPTLGNPAAATPPPPAAAPGLEDPFKHKPPTKEELDKLLSQGFATTVRVDRVIVPVVVTHKKGRPVLGLQQKDFQLPEDSVLQQIDYFAA